jgi:hypothetical protein
VTGVSDRGRRPGRRRRRRRLSRGTASSARSGAGDPTRSPNALPSGSPAPAAIDRCAAGDARPGVPPLEKPPVDSGDDHQQRSVDAHRSSDELVVGAHARSFSSHARRQTRVARAGDARSLSEIRAGGSGRGGRCLRSGSTPRGAVACQARVEEELRRDAGEGADGERLDARQGRPPAPTEPTGASTSPRLDHRHVREQRRATPRSDPLPLLWLRPARRLPGSRPPKRTVRLAACV